MRKPTVGIIGAGPAGLSAAYELSKNNVSCIVFEASSDVGGLCRSLPLWNQTVDLGPHRFFSTDPRVNATVDDVLDGKFSMVPRLTRIFHKNKFFKYPLEFLDVFSTLGPSESLRCLSSYIRERVSQLCRQGTKPNNFEDWIVRSFGQRLYEIFFKSYSEKLWGIRCNKIHSDFAAQRIRRLTFAEALKNALSSKSSKKHRSLVDEFKYPDGGTGELYKKMSLLTQNQGGSIYLNSPVLRVNLENGRATGIELVSGEKFKFDYIISTMPLTRLVTQFNEVPINVREAANRLRYRSTILVYLELSRNSYFDDQWLYIHSEKLKTGRITNFRNWSRTLNGASGATILCHEIWCFQNDSTWNQSDEDFIQLASQELIETGLAEKSDILRGTVIRIEKCYPIYDVDYKDHLQEIIDYLKKIPNLLAIGRYGSFKYNNQDHSILMGLLAADFILGKSVHDLWSVNTNYDVYQEIEPKV